MIGFVATIKDKIRAVSQYCRWLAGICLLLGWASALHANQPGIRWTAEETACQVRQIIFPRYTQEDLP